MQFKQKLAYFALGCAFVVAGQVLSATIIPQVTSHWEASLPFSGLMLIVGIPLFGALFKKTTTRGNNKSPEFDTVTCRSLRVVDASGKEVARLELTKRDNVNDVIQVFNSAGVSAYRVGVSPYGGSVGVLDKDGKPCIGMGVGPNGGGVRVSDGDNKAIVMMNITDTGGGLAVSDKTGKGVIAIGAEENGGMISVTSNDSRAGTKIELIKKDGCEGGSVSVWGKDGNILANMQVLPDGGGVSVWNKGGKPRAAMSISFGTNEGCVHVLGDDGNPRASIFTEADSGKVVVTNNKGVTTGQLP